MNRRTILLPIFLSLFSFVLAKGNYWGTTNSLETQASLVDNPGFQSHMLLENELSTSALYRLTWIVEGEETIERIDSLAYGAVINPPNSWTDVTNTYINNPDFAVSKALDGGICTYAKDISSTGGKFSGMQPVDSWKCSNIDEDARASGVFAVGSEETMWLGGVSYTVPATNFSNSTEGNLLGLLSVWTASSSYTQNVELNEGSYTFIYRVYNGGGSSSISKNLFGFIADDGTEYLSNTTAFSVGQWEEETVSFTLNEKTSGVISLGYIATNSGSADMPHLWIDEVKLNKVTNSSQREGYTIVWDNVPETMPDSDLDIHGYYVANEKITLYNELQSKYDAYHTKLANISGDNPDIASMLADVSEALAAGVLANNSDIETLLTQLVAAGKAYCEYRYWFGYDNTNLHSGILNGTSHIDVDTDMLDEGIHTLYLQLTDIDGVMSGAKAFHFQKMPKSMGEGTTCRLYVDEKLHHEELLTESSGNISWDVDCKSLAQGLHRYKAQVVSETGDVTEKSGLFMRAPTLEEMGEFRCFYMVDGNTANTKAGTSTGNAHHFDLDFSTLADGNHDLKYWFVSNTGISTHLMEASFVKAPPTGLTIIVEGNGVVEYSDSLLRDVVANYIIGDSTYVKMLMQPDEGYAIRSVTMNENDTITHLLAVDETDVQHRMALELETESTSIIEIVFDLTDFTKLGDVNNDNLIDVADLAMTVLHLIGGHPQPFVERQADANNDGDLNVGDLTRIVDLITGAVERGTHNVKGQKSNEKEVQNHNTTRISGSINSNYINIDIERPTDYTAFQMTLTLPEGLNATDVMLNPSYANNHQLEYGLKDDGRLAIVSYSLENSPLLLGEGTLLQIFADKAIEGEIQVSDIAVVSNDGKVIKLAPMSLSGASGISQSVASSDSNNMYDLVGRKVSASKRLRGIFIIGGHKIIFR